SNLAEKILKTRSAVEGERKIVTVMFSDVSGFTAMSERLDPEEVHAIMDRAFTRITITPPSVPPSRSWATTTTSSSCGAGLNRTGIAIAPADGGRAEPR